MMDRAESKEDVRSFFERAAEGVLVLSVGDMVDVRDGDVMFDPLAEDGYRLSTRLMQSPHFSDLLQATDLKHILAEMAGRAVRRHRHLESGHPGKTESKSRPTPGPRRYRV
jgi:hypothetical protein